jgi:hypothetical protein
VTGPDDGQSPSGGGEPRPAAPEEPDHEAVGIGVIRDEEPHTHGSGGAEQRPAAGGGPLDASQEARLPGLSSDDPAELERITTVVVQTRQDSGTAAPEHIAEVLRDRLQQVGVEVSDAELSELARQVSTGDADAPDDSGATGDSDAPE